MWKGSHLSVSKHRKWTHIFSFIIHWSLIRFVEEVTAMAEVMKEQSFWDIFGCCLFLVCGCSCAGDGVQWADDGDKKQVVKKLSTNFIFYHCCCVLFLAEGCRCLLCSVLVLMMGWMPTFWCSLMLCSPLVQFLLLMWEGGQQLGYCRVHRDIQ